MKIKKKMKKKNKEINNQRNEYGRHEKPEDNAETN